MKKYLLIILVIIPSLAIAQHKEKGFAGEMRATFDLGIDSYKNHSFGAQFVAGYKVNPYLRVGAGTGISWCKHFYENAHFVGLYLAPEYRETAAYVPVFANLKANFVRTGISPYVNVDLGYAAFIPFSDYAKENKLGIFVRPAFGVDFPISKGAINIEFGYKYQVRKFDLWAEPNGNYSQITFGVGYSF